MEAGFLVENRIQANEEHVLFQGIRATKPCHVVPVLMPSKPGYPDEGTSMPDHGNAKSEEGRYEQESGRSVVFGEPS